MALKLFDKSRIRFYIWWHTKIEKGYECSDLRNLWYFDFFGINSHIPNNSLNYSTLYQIIELEMRLELDDISIHAAKNQDKTICHSEKMTQTDIEILGRDGYGGYDKRFKTTPNGTSPCNHPTLSCQVFLFIFLGTFFYMVIIIHPQNHF